MTAIETVRSWPSWYRQYVTRRVRRQAGALLPGYTRAMRTVLLAAACGHTAELGLPENERSGRLPYNAYAHRVAEAWRVCPGELEELYLGAVDVEYAAETLRARRHEPWMTLLLAVRQQSKHRSLAPAMVKDFEYLPEEEKRILRWIGQQVAYTHHPDTEDVRILVRAAHELRAYSEAAWEILHTLTGDEGKLGKNPYPWTQLLTRVRSARELAGE